MITISERREQESAKNFVLRVLIDNIVNTRLEPGEKLNEPELCEQLGVSRTPFREAELELAQRRLIEIRPKIGTYISLIDAGLVEEVRHLRAVLETELAGMACEMLTKQELDRLWENVALWQMYIQRAQEEKIFALDKEFHKMLYELCGCPYWYELVENLAPHFDRTTMLSFRCRPAEAILDDHTSLLKAIEAKDTAAARTIAARHMQRYTENLATIRKSFPQYFKRMLRGHPRTRIKRLRKAFSEAFRGRCFYCRSSFARRRRQASSFTSSRITAVRGMKKMMPMMPKSFPPIMAATRV